MKSKKKSAIVPKLPTVATALKCGCAVADYEGRIGVVIDISYPEVRVTFGSGGPHFTYNWKDLRRVTRKEVNEAGLAGVGCYALGEDP